MIVITGHSHKLDGFCFVSNTDDEGNALEELAKAKEGFEIFASPDGDRHYLLVDDFDDNVDDFENECPRREGWSLLMKIRDEE